MPRPSINLHRKIRDILSHVDPLPAEVGTPLAQYNRFSTDLWNLFLDVEGNFAQFPSNRPPKDATWAGCTA